MKTRLLAIVLATLMAAGPLACTPTQRGAAIGGVTGAVAGAAIDDHKRSRGAAIGAASGAIIGGLIGHTYEVNKFCPTCGRRFHTSKQFCPYDGTPLRNVQ
ncbi:MAG: YMGG-like glycine zipper-containing protein [Candidatus Brocadiia bacterium]